MEMVLKLYWVTAKNVSPMDHRGRKGHTSVNVKNVAIRRIVHIFSWVFTALCSSTILVPIIVTLSVNVLNNIVLEASD